MKFKPHFKLLVCLVFTVFWQSQLFATHNRAGEISFRQIDDLSVEMIIRTYTKASSVAADRDSLLVFWGDGTEEYVTRANGPVMTGIGQGVLLPNDTKFNVYTAIHTYPGRATYTIGFVDPNRNGNILNVNPPNSVNVPFYIETTFTFLSQQFQGSNSSPILLQPPIDIGCVGQPFIHNPNAYDPDGDSISYELSVPLMDVGTPVPLYSFPNEIVAGPTNNISLNPVTGDFVWLYPKLQGEYNIAIKIHEWREGILISTTTRDMQISIEECDNEPPVIETIDEICVVAGDVIEFEVSVSDPDIDPVQEVQLEAFGGPLELDISPAEMIVEQGFQPQVLTGLFRWQTHCNHISDNYYQVIFRASDNFPVVGHNSSNRDTAFLSTLRTVRIKVVGPPPENLEASVNDNDEIELFWDKPYDCEVTEDEYFQGFSVWRRLGSNQFVLDTCDPGLNGKGYEIISFKTDAMLNGQYFFIDPDVEPGKTYCYRVLGEFARQSAAGNPFNRVSSLASNEACIQLGKDLPLITHIDVEDTGTSDGTIRVQWSKPDPIDLDTIRNAGPYEYRILRADGINGTNFTQIPGGVISSPTFGGLVDTFFFDNNLDTRDRPYTYRIDFYTEDLSTPLGSTTEASSIFLNISPTDRQNDLSWDFDVPWDNYLYTIFRWNNGTMEFDSIGVTQNLAYSDSGLINGEEYCYYVRAWGTYGIDDVLDTLVNRSQENCSIPIDNVAPCSPVLTVNNLCNSAGPDTPIEDFVNHLDWTNPRNICDAEDVAGYNIYYGPRQGVETQVIETLEGEDVLSTRHTPEKGISGCYTVTAYDFNGNESSPSNEVCVENCPLYELGNVFTPNQDSANELFIPLQNRFIDRINIRIYNQWGNLVFESMDPQINWDGTEKNGKNVSDGVYYYVCEVYENQLDGTEERIDILNGFIEVIR